MPVWTSVLWQLVTHKTDVSVPYSRTLKSLPQCVVTEPIALSTPVTSPVGFRSWDTSSDELAEAGVHSVGIKMAQLTLHTRLTLGRNQQSPDSELHDSETVMLSG